MRDIGTAASGIGSAVDKSTASIDELGRKSASANVTLRDMTNVMTALAGAVVVKEFIAANVAVENFGRAMTLVTGSSAGAGEAMDYVRKISDTLGLEISSTAQNFVNLSAAAKGTALEGSATRDIFEAVSKAMALLGKSSDETQGALLAVQQIISKGTVQSEELRGQLGERLPGAFQIAARAMGLTTAELGKFLESGKLTATEFLPKFAEELNKTFGDTTRVTTFNAELNRLITSLKDLAVSGGNTGIFGALTDGLRYIAQVNKSTVIEVDFLSGAFQALRTFLAGGGEDTETFLRSLRNVKIEAGIAQAGLTNYNESLAETERLARLAEAASAAMFSSNQTDAETARLARYEDAAVKSLSAVSDAYKLLGVNSAKVNADFIGAFDTLVKSSDATAKDIKQAFKSVLSDIDTSDDLQRVIESLQSAAYAGKITWENYAQEVDKASEAFLKNTGVAASNAKELDKQADAAKRAEENAAKMALELEKLASNERIKLIEAKVQLNVAQIQADTERIKANFESLDNTINSTADVIKTTLGLLSQAPDWTTFRILESQLETENKLRREAFELQKALTTEQIANLRAQTRNLERGDAIVRVDGAGLQPHLEAFMWEILKAIQVRVNSQGLQLLLGVS